MNLNDMAEKKGFILYCDLIHTIEQLPSDKAGELFKHILRYVNDLSPMSDDLIVNVTFEPIRQQLKRDLNKWEQKSVKRSEAGRLGGIKSGQIRKQNEANEAIALNSKQNEQVIDTVIVTVKDKVTVKEQTKEGGVFLHSDLYNEILNYFGINDHQSNHAKHRAVKMMIVTLAENGLIETLKEQFANYQIYKTTSKEKVHGFNSFIGTNELKFLDGGWNSDNWAKKLNDLKQPQNSNPNLKDFHLDKKGNTLFIPVGHYPDDYDPSLERF